MVVAVLGREIAVDATANSIAFGAHVNRLGNIDPAVFHQQDGAAKFEDAFVGNTRASDKQQA